MTDENDSGLAADSGAPGEAALVHFVANAPVAVAMFDRDMRYLAHSRDWADRFGIGERDIIGAHHYDLFPDLPHAWRKAHARALTGEHLFSAEDRYTWPDGRVSWERWRASPVLNAENAVIAITIFTEDITAEVEAREKLLRRDRRLDLLTRSLDVGVFEKDMNSGDLYVSDIFLGLLGLAPGEEPVGTAAWIETMRPRDPEAFREAQEKALDPAGDGIFRAHVHPLVNGEERRMQVNARVIFDGEGEGRRALRVIGLLIDQTESMRLHEALADAQRLETVGRMSGVVAHDFNNILTVILSNLELAALRVRDRDPELDELLGQAIEAAEAGAGFNKRLLALAGGHRNDQDLVLADAHISETWDIFQRVLNEGIVLRFEPNAPDAAVRIDVGELDGALLNLVVNARDAQPQGGTIVIGTELIELTEEEAQAIPGSHAGRFLCITVADEGSGMPAQVAAKAVEPFFTTKPSSAGTGLGLTSVSMTATRAGGFIRIETVPGDGTQVSIYLPYETGAAATRTAEDDEIVFGDGELILVVEDDAMVREAVMRRLEAIGYAVIEAANGDVALDLLDAGEPVDLVFSDVVMPGSLSGFSLAEIVRERFPELAILLTSGHVSRAALDGRPSVPNVELLAKPYTLRSLGLSVSRALGSSASQDEPRR